ncbi:MAG: DUF2723 domain-containing protein [Porphyromonas sp.]|nr:DUF2723 domain-containing protein [Porphyromonas sp.]
MNWKRFNLLNDVLGWLMVAIASIVYLLTIEPTASLWDCAEFVACDYRLEVGHPPGAPFYMLVYNVISQFAPDASQAGLYANATSAIISALCIGFLFWTMTHLLRRLITPEFRRDNPVLQSGSELLTISLPQSLVIFGGAASASLLYTFSDTFWFSAVEAEVYAFSSLFTAVVFWLMFKWDERANDEGSDRWLILIAYLMGLSIGVHLLNLLCLPAMALIYYYRKSKLPTFWGAVGAVLVSFGLIVAMMYGVVQGVPKMAGRFDWLFVNELGMSFNSGLYSYLAVLLVVLVVSVYEAHRSVQRGAVSTLLLLSSLASIILMGIPFLGDGYLLGIILSGALIFGAYYYRQQLSVRLMQSVQLSLLAIAIGFSSYGVILVRAIADTPMNENAPANAFSLRYYLAREQYGSAPLLYGPSFAAQPTGLKDGKEVLGKAPKATANDPDKYAKLSDQPEYEYDAADMMLFPRVYSRQHARYYNSWMGRADEDMTKPSFGENLRYFFAYQLNYMYWRYFMWNFVGRQNDLQGQGDLLKGNAITGIDFIDNLFVGDQSTLPEYLKNNKGRNVYYALPLLLGLLGMYYQVSRQRIYLHRSQEETDELLRKNKDKNVTPIGHQSFWIVFILFVMTGIAIVLYLNQTPGQPRERDYAFAGSFYAFAMWIGMGVPALWYLLRQAKLSDTLAAAGAVLIGLLIPAQMAGQNWDDHDRSGRTIARDAGINYLESVEPNAILFCYGDNDTFPLWYIQDVEGVRRDVRTMNLSYLGGDWYIDQMRRKTYTGEPVPMKHMTPSYYYYHEAAYMGESKSEMSLDEALARTTAQADQEQSLVPTSEMYLDIDREAVAKRLPADLQERILDRMPISLAGRRYVDRGNLTVLDVINANKWERPIYWTSTSPRDAFNGMDAHQLQTGMAFQLLPIDKGAISRVNAAGDSVRLEAHSGVRLEQMYENVMTKFRWGGADNPKVYMDETARNMMQGIRNNVFVPLARALHQSGDTKRAQEVLRRCLEVIRPEVVPHESYSLRLADVLYQVGMTKEADAINKDVVDKAMSLLGWMMTLSEAQLERVLTSGDLYESYQTALMGVQLAHQYKSEVLKQYEPALAQYHRMLGASQGE